MLLIATDTLQMNACGTFLRWWYEWYNKYWWSKEDTNFDMHAVGSVGAIMNADMREVWI